MGMLHGHSKFEVVTWFSLADNNTAQCGNYKQCRMREDIGKRFKV